MEELTKVNLNEEFEITDETMDGIDIIDDDDYEGVDGGLVLAIGGALIAGATALVITQKSKIKTAINDRRIKRLEKNGYAITKVEAEVEEAPVEEVPEEEKPKKTTKKKEKVD